MKFIIIYGKNRILRFCFRFANFQGDLSKRINSTKTGSGLNEYVTALFDTSLSWDDVKWLKRYPHIIVCELSLSRHFGAVMPVFTIRSYN